MKFLKDLFGPKSSIKPTDVTKRFDLIGRVGQGSMSKVWRARDTKTGRVVALKVLDKAKTERFESRFSEKLQKPTEGEVAVQLSHPNIVRAYEHGITTEGEPWLCMEFVEGVALSFLCDVQNEMMRENCLDFAVQLGDAVAHLHAKGWIHRDVCPRNVIVDDTNRVKLIDFGLTVPNTAPFQAPGNRTGTASYMAPELIKRQRTGIQLDVFSYAVTVFEMFAKEKPWKSSKSFESALKHLNEPPKTLDEYRPDLDPTIVATVMKGIERDPADRWQTIDEMTAVFRAALPNADTGASAVDTPPAAH